MSIAGRKINLDFAYSSVFDVPEEDMLAYDEGDVSQIGLKRGTFATHQKLMFCPRLEVDVTSVARHRWIRGLFGNLSESLKSATLVVSTDGVDRSQLSAAQIREVQACLQPVEDVSEEDIKGTEKWRNTLKNADIAGKMAIGKVAAALQAVCDASDSAKDAVESTLGIQPESATVMGTVNIEMENLTNVSYTSAEMLANLVKRHAPEFASDVEPFVTMCAINDVSFLHHAHMMPSLAVRYKEIESEMSMRAFTAPAFWRNLIAGADHLKGTKIHLHVVDGTGEADVNVRAGDKIAMAAHTFAHYLVALAQANQTIPEENRMFAFSRAMIVKFGLFKDSEEITVCPATREVSISAADIDHFIAAYNDGTIYKAMLYMMVISFKASGHHAGVVNITTKVSKVLAALGVQVTDLQIEQLVRSSVYNGFHPASVRLANVRCYTEAKIQSVSNALYLRLRPPPPTTAGLHNLGIFIDMLASGGFFETMNRMDEYRGFVAAMGRVKKKLWRCAPYASYLYGVEAEDPGPDRDYLGKFASYAIALRTAMPNSTLNMSPSLLGLANQAANTDFANQLIVMSYVRGFQRYHRAMVQASFERKHNVAAIRGVVED